MVETEAAPLAALEMVLVSMLVEPPETSVRVTGQTVVLSSITTVVITSPELPEAAGVTTAPAAVLDAEESKRAFEAEATERV